MWSWSIQNESVLTSKAACNWTWGGNLSTHGGYLYDLGYCRTQSIKPPTAAGLTRRLYETSSIQSRQYWEQSGEILISEVYSSLQQHAKKDVKIRVDKDVPWSLISKTLHTAQQAGYEDIEMLVISTSSL